MVAMAMTWGMAQNLKTSTFFRRVMYSRESVACVRPLVMSSFMHATAAARFSGSLNASSVFPCLLQMHLGQNILGAGSSMMSSR